MLKAHAYREEREIDKIAYAVSKAFSGDKEDSRGKGGKTRTAEQLKTEREFLKRLAGTKKKDQKEENGRP